MRLLEICCFRAGSSYELWPQPSGCSKALTQPVIPATMLCIFHLFWGLLPWFCPDSLPVIVPPLLDVGHYYANFNRPIFKKSFKIMLICEANHGLCPVTNRLLKLQLIVKAPALLRFRLATSSVFKRQLTSQMFTYTGSAHLHSNETHVLQ